MKNRKRIIGFALILFLGTIFLPVLTRAVSLPRINSAAAVVIDAENGEILFRQNADQLRTPASTTKILTAILAIECGRLDDLVTISQNAASVGEASVNLNYNDHLTLQELLYGALLKSGNDACVALAENTAPSEEEFIGLMNLKARTIGANQSTFQNTNGLPHPQHFTTAYDLAQIARYALRNPVFCEIVQTKTHLMRWQEPTKALLLQNTNKLLWSYPYTTGVKTGTTIKAGKCLVASAKYGQAEIIAVVLQSTNRFGDAQKLLDYGIRIKEIQANANREHRQKTTE